MLLGAPTNWSRLGWLSTEMDQWSELLTRWTPLISKYNDKKNSRTTTITEQMRLIISDCIALDKSKHLLNRIAASPNVIIDDLNIFNIKSGVLKDDNPSFSHTKIKDMVFAALKQLGGGDILIKCRAYNDSSRPSIPEEADCVQYVYQIGGTPPTSAAASGLAKDISSHATFTLSLGAENAEKKLYIYFRWYNTKHPELAGSWGYLQTIMIL